MHPVLNGLKCQMTTVFKWDQYTVQLTMLVAGSVNETRDMGDTVNGGTQQLVTKSTYDSWVR